MAVDRSAMVRNVFDSLAVPAIGPTVRYFPSTDSALRQIPYDPEGAKRILDSLGWRVDPKTGIRRSGGRDLRFSAILPSTSGNRVKMGTLIQEQLRKIGVSVTLDQMESGTFNARFYGHDFDAALASWHLGTSPASVREIWTSAAAKGGNNMGAYTSSTFDAYVDSAVSAFDPGKSKDFYTRAYQAAIDDAPAIWLYEPKLVIGIHKRVRTAPFRPDAWWWSLADWYIPESEYIPRDRVK
jgi:ABC-type transport system substrate-binding protein